MLDTERAPASAACLVYQDGREVDPALVSRLRAIVARRLDVHAKAVVDPRSAALVARLTIEQIAKHLHLWAFGQSQGTRVHEDTLDKILKRLEQGRIIPRNELLQFNTVRTHANFWVHDQSDAPIPDDVLPIEPTPNEIQPLLHAFDRSVDWFLYSHLRIDNESAQRFLHGTEVMSTSPGTIAVTTAMDLTKTAGTTWLDGEILPTWRGAGSADLGRLQLLFTPDNGEEAPRALEMRLESHRTYHVGRKRMRADNVTPNDLVIPTKTVSRDQASITSSNQRITLTNSSEKANVFLNDDCLQPREARALHHRVSLRFGGAAGTFLDSRYYEAAPESAVDPSTGLLNRHGLTREIALHLAGRRINTAFFARYPIHHDGIAAKAAMLLHMREPCLPVANLGSIAVLLSADDHGAHAARLDALKRCGLAPTVAGHLKLEGPPQAAEARLEAALGALNRLAAAGAPPENAIDLTRFGVPEISLALLPAAAEAAYAIGGGVVVFELHDVHRLRDLQHPAASVIELEFREMLGGFLTPADRIVAIEEGTLAVATHSPTDQLQREQVAAWNARSTMQFGVLEVNRSVTSRTIDPTQVWALSRDGLTALVHPLTAHDAHKLPALSAIPLSLAQRNSAPPIRVRELLRCIENSWRFFTLLQVADSRRGESLGAPQLDITDQWEHAPWLAAATAAANRLKLSPGRFSGFATALLEATEADNHMTTTAAIVHEARLALKAHTSITDRFWERLVSQLVETLSWTLKPFHAVPAWSLMAVCSTTPLDAYGSALDIDYLQFTGPHAHGFAQKASVTTLNIHPFVYYASWADGDFLPLDPWLRRVRSPSSGTDELVLVTSWPTKPGPHSYHSITNTTTVELEITNRQLKR